MGMGHLQDSAVVRRRRRPRGKKVDDKNPQDGNPLFQKCPSDFFIYENALKLFK